MRLLVTGASGLFGSRLAEAALKKGFLVYAGSRKDVPLHGAPVFFDISDEVQVRGAFEKVRPDFVVHSASLTDVDSCELNRELAWKTNVEGTGYVAEAAGRNGAFLVYVSTDYVFNGQKGCYGEDDEPDPVNYYGVTKLEAERVVANRLEDYCIARPSVIYGSTNAAGKINFALWLINKLRAEERVKIITDQWISPTLNTSMADMILEIVERRLTGIFHVSGATRISRYDFAGLLVEVFGLDAGLIDAVEAAGFPWVAKRPRDSSLDTEKAHKILKNKPLKVYQALKRLKQELGPAS